MSATTNPGRRLRFVRRIHHGEMASAASAVVLLALMFAAAWYGVDRPPGKTSGSERATSVTAWQALTVVRWLMLLTILAAVGSLILHLTQRAHGTSTDTNGTVTVLGTIIALLLTYRVLIDLPSPESIVDQKLGAYLGLLSAYGIALGGYHALRGARARQRAQDLRSRDETGPHEAPAEAPSAPAAHRVAQPPAPTQ